MNIKLQLRAAIEQNYGIEILKCIPGPRQFVAETFILDAKNGMQYFCKLVDKPLFIPGIIKSLPIVAEMYANGIDRVSFPIKGATGFHLLVGNTLIVLFNYINAPQSYDYSPYALGRLTAQIQNVTPFIKAEIPRETFEFVNRTLFDYYFEGTLTAQIDDRAICELQQVLRRHEAKIRYYLGEYLRLCHICKAGPGELVITHGDAPGNILVNAPDDIYIIDWDDIVLAPAERDLWIMDHLEGFVDGYKSARPGYVANGNIRGFFIYKYYFSSMMHYFFEIFKNEAAAYRIKHVRDLDENLITGWMTHKMKKI
jgi:hypothetical protein